MMKRIMSLALALLMLVSLFPATVLASGEPEVIITPTEGEAALPTGETEEAPCATCGNVGCASLHENWCALCKADDCGIDHSAQQPEPPAETDPPAEPMTCATCGNEPCTCESAACEICGNEPCTCEPTAACEICGNEPCTCESAACEICGNEPCTCEATTCETCGNEPCTCEGEGGEDPSEPTGEEEPIEPAVHPDTGKFVKLDPNGSMFWPYDSNWSQSILSREQYPTYMVITNVLEKDGVTYYRLAAEKGEWAVGCEKHNDNAYLESSKLVFVTKCADCKEFECAVDHNKRSDAASGVEVRAESIPAGVSLSVKTADVSAQLAAFGVPAEKMVFGLDISLVDAENGEYQPGSATVKIPVSAAPGTKIGLLHTHNGVTTYMGLTTVLSDGTVEFKTNGFSEFAGFTVDFHYNDIDYSIGGLTSITLSELFPILEIDRDPAYVIDVKFSDPSLISVTKLDGDWRLDSLQAFDTEETLEITFADGEIIVIDVTDASGTNISDSGDTVNFFVDVEDTYGIYASMSDLWGLKSGEWYLQIDGKQVSHSKTTNMTYGGNHFGIRSDYYWFEMSTESNTQYKESEVESFKFKTSPGTIGVTYNAHSNIVYNNTSYCRVRQQSQAVYAGHTDIRCVKIYADGNFVQEIWPVMPSRDKERGYSTSDIYVDALYGPYYTSSVSVENNTYVVRLYSRYTVSGSVADSKGTASPSSQYINYGNSGNITFTASTGNHIDYIMDGTTKVEVNDVSSYTYTVSNVTSARSVVAYTKPISYTVSYAANGGSGTTAAQTFNYGSSVALRANGFTAPSGYQFLGWYSSADKAVYTAGATYARNESTTMTALWGKQSSASAWNNEFYVLPGATTFTDQMRIIDGATRNTELTIGRPAIVADSNTYYVAPGTTLTFERSGGRWRVDNDDHSGITASVGTSWSTTNTITVTVGGSAPSGSNMMIYSRSETGTTVNCARIIVASKAEVTTKAINDTQNIYRVGVYILNDSTKIPGEPNYTSGVSMINVNGGMNYRASAKGVIRDNIATSAHYIPSLDGSCTMGVVDYTGHETIPYMDEALLNDAMNRVIQALADGTVLTAADGTNLKELYDSKGEAYIRNNYAVRPHIAKLMTGLNFNELGWHIDCSIYPLKTVTLTYNLNAPAGYVLKNQGTPAPGIFTGDLEAQAATFTVSTSIASNAVITASVSGAADTASLTFKGWNTEPNGTGTTYAPGSTITLTGDETLYAQWTGGDFNTGTLEIYKKVNVADYSEQPNVDDTFTFSVNLSGNRAYSIYDTDTGALISSGTMTNGTFSLKDGQFIRFEMVPVAANAYTVTETNTPANYSATAATQSVTLKGGYINQITFTNTYNKPLTFGVTYEYTGTVPAGAAALPAAQNHTYNTSVSVADEPAAVAAYTFSGWTTSDATVSNGSFTMPAKAVKFTGKWTPIEYTATFVFGEGKADETKTFTVEDALALPTVEKTGYTYEWKVTSAEGNWDADASYTGASVSAGKYGNVTFTLVWTPKTDAKYVVHYYRDGTTEELATSKTVTNRTYDSNHTENAITITGYELVSAETQTVTAGYDNNEIIFYYKAKSYTLTVYASFGAPNSSNNYTVVYGQSEHNDLSDRITVPNGKLLKGLYTERNSGGKQVYGKNGIYVADTDYWDENGKWKYDGNLTVYADWEDVVYTITRVNTLTNTQTMATYTTYGTPVELGALTHKGYTFDGWKVQEQVGWWYTNTLYGSSDNTRGAFGNVTFLSQWTLIDYTIAYDLAGGVLAEGVTNPEIYTVESESFTLANPSREGYTFAGWTGTGLDEATETVTVATGSTGDRAYTATWTPVEYTITYELDGGTLPEGQSNPTSYTVEDSFTLANPTKVGHTFAGWIGTDLDAATETVTVAKGSTGDRSYTAKWTPIKYEVKWYNDDEKTYLIDTTYVAYGTMPSYGTPTKPETDEFSYTFIGWSPALQEVTGNAEYVAQYQAVRKKYTVTFVNDDGTVLLEAKEYEYGTPADEIEKPEDPEKEATAQYTYTFAGWDPAIDDVKGTVIYTATYTATVNQYALSGEWETPAHGKNISPSASETYLYGVEARITFSVKPGYTITGTTQNGWYHANDSIVTSSGHGFPSGLDENTHIVAHTALIPYTITYDFNYPNSTETVTTTDDFNVEETVTLAEAPTVDGYKFVGWKTEATHHQEKCSWNSGTYEAEQNFGTGNFGDVTFVAQWEVVEYTITYELDDGALAEGESNPGTYTIETETFTLNNPTKAGYEFIGWAETADDESGSKSVAVEKGTTGNKTFYAIWKRSLVDLTISTSSTDASQSFIFTVSGKRSDGEAFKPIEVVLVGSDSITIKDMPVGQYTVTEKDGWSWRQSTRGSQSADLRDEGKTVAFSFGVDRHYWLSGCSYYGRRKGGNG